MIYETTFLVALALAGMLLVVPRKYFVLPFILGTCFLPADQRIIIADLDFTVLRILVVAGVFRLWLRREIRAIRPNTFDKLLLAWAVTGAVIYVAQWQDTRSFIYKCGVLFDVLGMYWLFRQNIKSLDDIVLSFKALAGCALLLVPFVAVEWATGKNPFVALGTVGTAVREGHYRCQACFPHSIMLGLFWGTLLPVFVGLAVRQEKKLFYVAASAACVFIVSSTASSTPIGTLVAIMLLLPLFPYRRYGRRIAWLMCGCLAGLHLVMQAPVWHLISRVNMVGGSTGWHRYFLIDQAVKHFNEWALLGTRNTAHWGRGLGDITNQYVAEAVSGGLVTLVLFVCLMIFAAKILGSYSLRLASKANQWLMWCICVSVLGHCIAFLGVGYFGQIRMLLYLMFGIVAAVYEMSHASKRLPTRSYRKIPDGATLSVG